MKASQHERLNPIRAYQRLGPLSALLATLAVLGNWKKNTGAEAIRACGRGTRTREPKHNSTHGNSNIIKKKVQPEIVCAQIYTFYIVSKNAPK
jgi:hypothetical protein